MIERHRHDWHQLIYASAGVLHVWTERGSWIAPPHWAICVPADDRPLDPLRRAERPAHALSPPGLGRGPARAIARVIGVSPLLRELILRATRDNMLDRRDPAEAALATLIVDEFRQSGAPPFELPQPASPLGPRRRGLIAAGAPEAASTAALARAVGLGVRTLERHFLAETGLSPGRWRRQHALLGALERLAGRRADQAGRRRGRLCDAQRLHRRLPRRLRHHARPLFRRR